MMKTTIAAALALVVASGAAMAEFKDGQWRPRDQGTAGGRCNGSHLE